MHIVVVEDHLSLAKGIAYQLRDDGHAVDLLHDGDDAASFLPDSGADLVVLDVNLPGRSGIDVLRGMRSAGDQRPVLLLTARSETGDKIAGLDAGADDYLVKPFEMDELTARLRALARRVEARVVPTLSMGPLTLDPAARTVTGPDATLDMPRREVSLFEALLKARGRTLSKEALLDALYGTGQDAAGSTVEVYVSRLRKRIAPFGIRIVVRRGLGYEMRID